jgi:hypothetical protein
MSKSTRVNTTAEKKVRKKRPPVTGTLIGVRLQPLPLSQLDAWIAKQGEPGLGRPEAIRRIVEPALAAESAAAAKPRAASRPAKSGKRESSS